MVFGSEDPVSSLMATPAWIGTPNIQEPGVGSDSFNIPVARMLGHS